MAGLGGRFQPCWRLLQEGSELLASKIVDPDVAGGNGIDPTMKVNLLLSKLQRDRRTSAQVIELSPDVFLGRFDQAVIAFEIDVVFPASDVWWFQPAPPIL
jgi:hypothetical protein